MLILGRKVGQSVIIGNDIKVTVLHIGSQLKLEIDSPDDLKVSFIKQKLDGSVSKKSRVVGETVVIGDRVKVSILQVETGVLRVAIDAPKEIGIFREEICPNKQNKEPNEITQKHFIIFDSAIPKMASF